MVHMSTSIYSARPPRRPPSPAPKPDQGEKFMGGIIEPSIFGNAARLNHRELPLQRNYPSSFAVCGLTALPRPHRLTPPSRWIPLMAWGWFGCWDRTGWLGKCYLAQIPPANTPDPPPTKPSHTSQDGLHPPPPLDPAPWLVACQGGRKSPRLFPRTWTSA